jgi:hypothetical protein
MEFIPAGYEGQREPDSSHPILVGQAASQMRNLLNNQGLRQNNRSPKTSGTP